MAVTVCKTIIILFAIANVTAIAHVTIIALSLIEANAKSTIIVEKEEEKKNESEESGKRSL